ncbi:MAG: VWA domain-containing protein, partial [Actinobacteria bacterium]|nr:VWA domain-containing protein [Actinomycetota bacterium]
MKLKCLTIIAIVLIIFSISFSFPAAATAQESEDILITKTDFEDYPKVNIYIYFKEGSEVETLDLKQEDFIVLENGEDVSSLSVKGLDEIPDPIGVILVLDTSGSMKGEPITDAAKASSLFLDEMRSIDEFSVASFADNVAIHSGLTSNRKKLRDSISEVKAQGETSLFDGIFEAIDQFNNRSDIEYRYLIVLSDGMDTASKHNAQDVIDKALQEGVIIYSIALLSPEFNPDDIRNISRSTGGEMLAAADSKELKELYKSISKKIINQYKISYTSLWPNAEGIVISISVEKSGLSVTTETGYE